MGSLATAKLQNCDSYSQIYVIYMEIIIILQEELCVCQDLLRPSEPDPFRRKAGYFSIFIYFNPYFQGSPKYTHFGHIFSYFWQKRIMLRFELIFDADYETANVISDIAGILGITAGLSAISVLELFYALLDVAINFLTADRVSMLGA